MHIGKDGPPTVAASIGREADKLLQRFHLLDADNRAVLLESAFHMIERQEDAKLPPRDRRIKRLVDHIDRCMELLANSQLSERIQRTIWRGMLADDMRELASLGINYFGAPTAKAA